MMAAAPDQSAGTGAPVMVVEDDRSLRLALSLILRGEGYEVSAASDGAEAMSLLLGGARPAVILLDLIMPGGNGLAFRAEQLRHPELGRIPVVVFSGRRPSSRRHRLLRGCTCLTKPVDLAELLAAVARRCRRCK